MRYKNIGFILAENAYDGFDFDQQMEFIFKEVDEDQWEEAAIYCIVAYADGVYNIKNCVHYNHPIVQKAIESMRSVVNQGKK